MMHKTYAQSIEEMVEARHLKVSAKIDAYADYKKRAQRGLDGFIKEENRRIIRRATDEGKQFYARKQEYQEALDFVKKRIDELVAMYREKFIWENDCDYIHATGKLPPRGYTRIAGKSETCDVPTEQAKVEVIEVGQEAEGKEAEGKEGAE